MDTGHYIGTRIRSVERGIRPIAALNVTNEVYSHNIMVFLNTDVYIIIIIIIDSVWRISTRVNVFSRISYLCSLHFE